MDRLSCEICAQIDLKFTRSNRILFQGTFFTVWPALGALGVGHILVIPNNHISSIAQVNMQNGALNIELNSILETYRKVFGNFRLHEHGLPSFNDSKSQCVQHAHLHVLPISLVDYDITEKLDRFENFQIDSIALSDINTLAGCEYILAGSRIDALSIIRDPDQNLPSQLIRKIFWEENHLPGDHGWRSNMNSRDILKTIKLARNSFHTLKSNKIAKLGGNHSKIDLGLK